MNLTVSSQQYPTGKRRYWTHFSVLMMTASSAMPCRKTSTDSCRLILPFPKEFPISCVSEKESFSHWIQKYTMPSQKRFIPTNVKESQEFLIRNRTHNFSYIIIFIFRSRHITKEMTVPWKSLSYLSSLLFHPYETHHILMMHFAYPHAILNYQKQMITRFSHPLYHLFLFFMNHSLV